MQNFDELKNMWQNTNSNLPSAEVILMENERSRKKMIQKNAIGIITLGLTFCFITYIGFYYDFELSTTKLGIIIILMSICLGIFFNTNLIKLLIKKVDALVDNQNYLNQLKEIRNKQRQIQTTGISVYFLLLTTGIMLYMYEFAKRDLTFGIIFYSITLAWIAFNWFYLRKRIIKKQQAEINKQIENIENLMARFKNE